MAFRLCSTLAKPITVDLFYDVVSPYSWFAFEALLKQRGQWNIDWRLRPAFLAGIAKAAGNSAPMLVPNKGKYMATDLARNAKYFGVPLKVVPFELIFDMLLQRGSLTAMRYLVALEKLSPDLLEAGSRSLWIKLWNQGQNIAELNNISDAFKSIGVTEEDMNKIHEMVNSDEVKNILKSTTDEAIELEAFGLPTIIVRRPEGKDQLYFGSDRFPLIAQELGQRWDGPQRDAIADLLKGKL